MKKIIFLILFFIISIYSFSQTDTLKTRLIYCEVVGTQGLFSTKVTIVINNGETNTNSWDNRYRDEAGKVVKFNNMVDVVNFMANDGWEWDKAFPISSGNSLVYHFYFKKLIKV